MEGDARFRRDGVSGQWGAGHRDTCCYDSSPFPGDTPLSFSLLGSCPLRAAVPLLEPMVGAATEVLCTGPSTELFSFSPGLAESLLIFTAKYCVGSTSKL